MAMTANDARAELRKITLLDQLAPEIQQKAIDQLLNGESCDKVAQQINDWVAEADWEARHEAKEAMGNGQWAMGN